MKNLAIGLAFIVSVSAYGQGAIDFRNATSQLPSPPDRRVLTVEGTGVIGTQFMAQLFFASDASNPAAAAAVVEGASAFRATALPGFWAGGTRTLVGVAPGESRCYIVRVWDSSLGSYAQAVASGRANSAVQSQAFEYTPPSDPTAPPSAFFMLNFMGIPGPMVTPPECVPEPPAIALAALAGLCALALLRRKRKHLCSGSADPLITVH